MSKWQIWMEGNNGAPDWGENWPAKLVGEVEAETFTEACDIFFADDPYGYYQKYKDGHRSHWACGLYDNEAEARKRNG